MLIYKIQKDKTQFCRGVLYLLCCLLCGCQPTLMAEFEDLPVVSCFLEAGESPIMRIGKLIAFRPDAVYSDQDVSRLSVVIRDETLGMDYLLSSEGEGIYKSSELIVQSGHTYQLSFEYNHQPIFATTTVPESPKNVVFSAASIGVMSGGMAPKNSTNGIEITWSNEDREYYIVEGKTMSSAPIQSAEQELSKSFKLEYTQSGTATLTSSLFNYYGSYEVYVIKIAREYAIISQGAGDTSGTLTDIRGNIEGGYGIFTGIHRFTRNVNVYQQTSPFD